MLISSHHLYSLLLSVYLLPVLFLSLFHDEHVHSGKENGYKRRQYQSEEQFLIADVFVVTELIIFLISRVLLLFFFVL